MTDGNEPIDDTGSASTDRRNFLKAAGVAGASAVAVAGATHGKFGLANHGCAGRYNGDAETNRQAMVALEMGCR